MQHKSLHLIPILLSLSLFSSVASAQELMVRTVVAPEDTIMPILRQRVDTYRQSVGLVAGIVYRGERVIYNYGTPHQRTTRKVSGPTVFEIGELTHLFTSFLLADMAEREELDLNDPISKFLPPAVQAPTRNGQQITLLHLATHTSGLPNLPPDYTPEDPDNPLAGYTLARLYDFLSTYALTRDIGTEYEFSRIGSALLGHILELAAKRTYNNMLVRRLLAPFKMTHTRILPNMSMRAHLATGHDEKRIPVDPSELPTLVGADALRSSGQDLLTFLSANMGYMIALPESTYAEEDSALYAVALAEAEAESLKLVAAFETMTRVRSSMENPDLRVAMGWRVMRAFDRDFLWQSGGTKGYRCFIGFDTLARKGVVVLSNTASNINDIGFHLLHNAFRLAPPPRIDAGGVTGALVFDAYVGSYAFDTGMVVRIMREGDRLYGQPAGQRRSELIPRSNREFYLEEEDAYISFIMGETGQVTHMTFVQKGQTYRARRIE